MFKMKKPEQASAAKPEVPEQEPQMDREGSPDPVGESKPVGKLEKAATKKTVWSMLKWLVIVVLLASLLLNISTYIFPVVRHYGNSMSPTLQENQLLLMFKTDSVERGDVIAFYYNNNIMVRRVIAGPGDTVNVDIFGNVAVNGETIEEDYVDVPALGQTDVQFPYTVPANSFFVMGDKRETAMDSRLTEIGSIPRDRIVGKLIFSLSPFGSV